MNKVEIFIVGLLCSIPFLLTGQNLKFRQWNPHDTSYSAPQVFPVNAVADDFGPRRYSPYNFHLGIDYNCSQDDGNADKWNLILAPESGTTVDVNRLWTNQFTYKQLCYQANDHRYIFGHVYDHSGLNYIKNHGTIVLKGMLFPDIDKWAQIFIIKDTISGIPVTFTYVLGQIDGGQVAYNGDTLTASNQITVGMPLVPLGDADATGQAHLHLNTIPLSNSFSTPQTFYASNPLQYINYVNPSNTLKLFCQANDSIFIPQYGPSAATISPMALRVQMQTAVSGFGNKRYDHIFDVDKVQFLLKGTQEPTYQLISGPTEESNIILGGILGENKVNHPNPNFGNWSKTGVDSRAYNSGYPNQPYDIYHYSNFNTRIHKDHSGGTLRTAELPGNARYPDGEYALFAQVTNVRGQVTGSDTLSFTLDNFKPYVHRVEVSQSPFYNSGSPFYIAAWEEHWQPTDWTGTGKLFFRVHKADPIQAASGQYLKIVAVTSVARRHPSPGAARSSKNPEVCSAITRVACRPCRQKIS